MTDERPESLAAQAASWVPPWERAPRPPDPNFAAKARAGESDDEELAESNLADDDDFDPAVEGPDPATGDGVPAELPPFPEEAGGPPTVDAPREMPGEAEHEPTDVGAGPEVPLPDAIEQAAENEIGNAPLVDAPFDGDDAGDVFDAAADDDIEDDAELDLPFAEEVPGREEDENPTAAEAEASAPEADQAGAAPSGVARTAESGAALLGKTGPSAERAGPASSGAARPRETGSEVRPGAEQAGAARPSGTGSEAGPGAEQAGAALSGETGPGKERAEAAAPEVTGPGVEQAGTASPAASEPSLEEATDSGPRSGDSGTPSAGDPVAASSASPADSPGPSAAADAAARGGADVEAAVGSGAVARQPVSRARPSSGIPAQGRGSKGGAAASGALSTRTEEEAQAPAPMDDAELRAALEAILLVVDEPVAEMQLAQIVEQPAERVGGMLEDISARYTAAGHGFDLRRAAGGWRLYTRPEYAAYVERFVLDGQSVRLTQAALETLAVVAYKQPVTRSRISAIRGVNCDGVMRTLNTRGLIEECGIEGETGAFLYRTTALFLEKLGLNSVDQLPPLAPFLPDDVEEVLDASG